MPTSEQIRVWEQAGEAVRRARQRRRDVGEHSPEEIKQLRETAAQRAAVCADCFAPLKLDASVTLVARFVEHIPANPLGFRKKARDRFLPVPICLHCWLIEIATPWWGDALPGIPQDHLNRARPLDSYHDEVRRLRCEACERPLRVETRRFRRLPLRERCCCADCLHKVELRRNNERRRVRHEEQACIVCGEMFIPKQSTAKTCSNTCRQRLFRQRRAEK